WMARDVVAHILRFPTWEIPASVSERLRVEATLDPHGGAVVDDPLCGFRRFRDAVQRVLEDPASPAEVTEYIDHPLSFDPAQHWGDLAKGTGRDATMDPDEVNVLWTTLSSMPPAWWKLAGRPGVLRSVRTGAGGFSPPGPGSRPHRPRPEVDATHLTGPLTHHWCPLRSLISRYRTPPAKYVVLGAAKPRLRLSVHSFDPAVDCSLCRPWGLVSASPAASSERSDSAVPV